MARVPPITIIARVDKLEDQERGYLVELAHKDSLTRYCVDENDIVICLPGKCTCGRRT